MKDFQKRVMREKHELDRKVIKLENFLNDPPDSVAVGELRLLNSQLGLMKGYSDILAQRVAKF